VIDINRFVLWGSAGHAKVLAEIIAIDGGSVLALFDNCEVNSVLPGVSLYNGPKGFREWAEDNSKEVERIAGLVAIGGGRGRDRMKIQELFRQYKLCIPVLSHPTAVVSPTAQLGPGCQVLALANVAADAQLGEACIINHRASVDHECILGSGVHLGPGATLCGCVSVADNAFIGAGSTVLPRLSIGADCIIGAGAVVTQDVPSGATVIGNPAKPIASIKSK